MQQHTDTMLLRITSQRLTKRNITVKYDMSDIDESKFKTSTSGLDIKKRSYIMFLADSLCNRIMSYIPDGENAVFILKKYTKAHVSMNPYYGQLQTSSGKIVDFISAMHYLSSEDISMQDMVHNILRSHPDYTESVNSKTDVKDKLYFLQKESTAIAKQYSCVCVEDLNMKALSNRGFGNGKATMDNGYGMFLDMLEYKLRDRGGRLVKVDRFYPSSQLCSCCGFQNPALKDLSIRRWDCPNCGTANIDRDVNAAKNIKQEGLRLLTA